MTETSAEQELRDRERELAEVQRIAKVGGVVVDLRDGFQNRRSPEYLAIHGLPLEAKNESHYDWVMRIHSEDRERAERQFLDMLKGASERNSSEYRIVRPSDGQSGKLPPKDASSAIRTAARSDWLGLTSTSPSVP